MPDAKATWPGWETVRLIGRGSFGSVYEIQREVFGEVEKAALKVISIPQNESDIDEMYSEGYDEESISSTFKSHLQSIVAEYTLMRKMSGCSNVVSCEDIRYVEHSNGFGWDIFIKMELLVPLLKDIAGDVSEETVLKIGRDICSALVACKEYGIVHRDIKPQNIFVSKYGDYKLGDFGIAKIVERTMGGTKIGTYKYMAPEVYNNQPYGSASDIYSLGLVLYWLLNGKRMPFMPLPPTMLRASDEESSRARRLSGEKLPEPKNGSEALKRIILKACAYDPKERYSSAEEMRNALDAIITRSNLVAEQIEPMTSVEASEVVPDDVDDCEVWSNSKEQPVPVDPQVPVFTTGNSKSQKNAAEEDTPEIRVEEIIAKKSPKKKKMSIMAVCAAAAAFVAGAAILLLGTGGRGADQQATAHSQSLQSVNIEKPAQMTERPVEPVTVPTTEALRDFPDGTILIDESWENGNVAIVELDDTRVWIQITDHRPNQQYGVLGTPWEINFWIGEKLRYGDEQWQTVYPFYFGLSSMAHSELLDVEYRQGKTPDYFEEENSKPLAFEKRKCLADGWMNDKIANVDVGIEKENDTYTAIVTLPDWFDVTLVNDLVSVDVYLYDTDFWAAFCETGGATVSETYSFTP